jgi:hypothetical protein
VVWQCGTRVRAAGLGDVWHCMSDPSHHDASPRPGMIVIAAALTGSLRRVTVTVTMMPRTRMTYSVTRTVTVLPRRRPGPAPAPGAQSGSSGRY